MDIENIIVGTKDELIKYFCQFLAAPHDYHDGCPGMKKEYQNLRIVEQIEYFEQNCPLGIIYYLEKTDDSRIEGQIVKQYIHVRKS